MVLFKRMPHLYLDDLTPASAGSVPEGPPAVGTNVPHSRP
jgi:hypothetical protein